MKNIINYLDDYINDEMYESSNKHLRIGGISDYIKSNRKASREEEIRAHGKPISHNHVWKNKKNYNRKQKHKTNW